jgi:hypothetical protein
MRSTKKKGENSSKNSLFLVKFVFLNFLKILEDFIQKL